MASTLHKITHRCQDEKLHRPLTNFNPKAYTDDLSITLDFFLNNKPEVNGDNLNPIFEQFYLIITETCTLHHYVNITQTKTPSQ